MSHCIYRQAVLLREWFRGWNWRACLAQAKASTYVEDLVWINNIAVACWCMQKLDLGWGRGRAFLARLGCSTSLPLSNQGMVMLG